MQIDSLELDEAGDRPTAPRSSTPDFDRRIDAEAEVLRELRASLVVGESRRWRSRRRRAPGYHQSPWPTSPGTGSTPPTRCSTSSPRTCCRRSARHTQRPPWRCGCRCTAASSRCAACRGHPAHRAALARRDERARAASSASTSRRSWRCASFGAYGARLPYAEIAREQPIQHHRDRSRGAGRGQRLGRRRPPRARIRGTPGRMRPAVSGSGRRRRRRGDETGLRHRVGVHRQRRIAAVHLARTVRGARRVRPRDAGDAAVPVHLPGGPAGRAVGRRHSVAPGAAGAARGRWARMAPRSRRRGFWRRQPHDVASGGYAFAAYTALAIVITFPLVLHLSGALPHDLGDPLLSTAILWWNAHTLPFTERWWNGFAFFPAPGMLAFSDHRLGRQPDRVADPMARAAATSPPITSRCC